MVNIADEIASILAENPDGLKASEIATRIGCVRKNVNSYLYAHKDMYEQHEGYIWTAKSVQKKMPHPARSQHPLPSSSNSVSIQQTTGNTVVSTLTITPNGHGYCINSTNNHIICCDCKKFFSIHAQACPFCGCPLHYVADVYYKRCNTDVRGECQQHQLQQKQYQQEQERKKHNLITAILRDSNYKEGHDINKSIVSVKQLEEIHRDIIKRRDLMKAIPRSAELYFRKKGVSLDILSTRTLEVIEARCADFQKNNQPAKLNIAKQEEQEFKKAVSMRIGCNEESMRSLYYLYGKYARGERSNKKEYNITTKDNDGAIRYVDINFFQDLYAYFRNQTAEMYKQAYNTTCTPRSYMESSGCGMKNPEKGLSFIVFSNLANIKISISHEKEVSRRFVLLDQDAAMLLSDIDIPTSLKYRAVTISQDDIIVESDKLIHNHSSEKVFLLVGVFNDLDQLETKRYLGIYCKICRRYYIGHYDFMELIMSGRANAKMLTSDLSEYDYNDDNIFSTFSPESLLRKCGYTVNANDNLSDEKRQKIIKSVIENRLYSPDGIISHLSFLVSMSKKVETRDMKYAIQKWSRDIAYIKQTYIRS